jgi:hypothetical protein
MTSRFMSNCPWGLESLAAEDSHLRRGSGPASQRAQSEYTCGRIYTIGINYIKFFSRGADGASIRSRRSAGARCSMALSGVTRSKQATHIAGIYNVPLSGTSPSATDPVP